MCFIVCIYKLYVAREFDFILEFWLKRTSTRVHKNMFYSAQIQSLPNRYRTRRSLKTTINFSWGQFFSSTHTLYINPVSESINQSIRRFSFLSVALNMNMIDIEQRQKHLRRWFVSFEKKTKKTTDTMN